MPHTQCGQCGHRRDKWKEVRVTTELRTTIPDFSTSLAAAWTLVEKLKLMKDPKEPRRHLRFSLEFSEWHMKEAPVREWSAYWGDGDYHPEAQYHLASADTAPHAICLAALKAVGVG